MSTPISSSIKKSQTENFSTPTKPSQSQATSISKVRVIVRVRPFLRQEISTNLDPISCISELDTSEEVTVHLKDQESSRSECYKIDSYFGQDDKNVSQIFEKEVRPLIPGIFHGYNATVFAYGATGSGKTYTMQGTDELPGLMPLAMSVILSMCQSTGSTAEISYYEVYMDRCYDLLEFKPKEIAVLDDKDGQIHLKGLSRVSVCSMDEFHEVFSCAIQRRKVAHTGLNDVSSRSHGVLVISLLTSSADNPGNLVGKLNLIDLAGNEDNRRTCNEGIRLQESAKINQSLFALSNVIYALNSNKLRVPYRESKLTRILQDSLGGTSRAVMVACLNPWDYQESVHTVSLAARSRLISNCVSSAQKQETSKVKVDMEAKLRAWLESKGKAKSSQRTRICGSPLLNRTPCSVSSVKKLNTFRSSTKQIANTNQGALNSKESNLFDNGGLIDPVMETRDLGAEEDMKEEFKVSTKGIVCESNTCIKAPLDKEEKMLTIEYANSVGSSPITGKIKALSLRNVLSPVHSNINVENMPSEDQLCATLSDPKTPQTPFASISATDMFQRIDTPLDKFNDRSSKLKSSLVQEYIDFLNSSSREELLELKGIGDKMAEYILELRETSPLKSLSDLEKLGLSSKQVHNMFRRVAREIFS